MYERAEGDTGHFVVVVVVVTVPGLLNLTAHLKRVKWLHVLF